MNKSIMLILLFIVITLSCGDTTRSKRIAIFTNYGSSQNYNSELYWQLSAVNTKIEFYLLNIFKKQHYIDSSILTVFDLKNIQTEKLNNICMNNNLKFDLNAKKLLFLASSKNIDILIRATPYPVNKKYLYDLKFDIIHLDKNCVVQSCSTTYKLSSKSYGIDYNSIKKISDEIAKIVLESE